MTVFILIAFLLITASGYLLRALNLRHLRAHGNQIPPGFEGIIDGETLRRTVAYTLDQSRVGLLESIIDNLLLLLFLFGGLLPLYDRWVASLAPSFIGGGVLFFLLITLAQTLLGIPFDLYRTFRLEARYGFNTTTPRLWFADLLKGAAITVILLGGLAAGALALVRWSPAWWWLLVWGFLAAVSLFLMYLSPYVIEPLFNKFEPVKEAGLEDEIRAMAERAGLTVSRVMQVDASKRSQHSNAYFTGIGRVKRIVLYDTLIRQMTHQEILAVLAHEIGHWKKGHIWKQLVMTEVGALLVCYVAWWLLGWGGLPGLLGMDGGSFAAQLTILAFLGSPAAFPLTPFFSWLSRRHEWEADRYAMELSGRPEALASALIKLSAENLANLHPHPIFAWFYYSHPPVVERVQRLRDAPTPVE
ncbi:M48 family metallopeptidase [Geobacter sp. AOG1]|uniref:M48 family metallopeptidase n=1 Tax=Geobacter sp. AOG1 TaxID=1566346 RepID=UPI001CC82724|nr:M48 family metallopeptidase [Geobacter sp. AOG1]GFE57245.1 peptidase M48 [Geobacter sp. AOG1]